MSSNIKGKNPAKDSPTEPFKRAVTGCLRAIARKRDLEVSFAAERPGIVGGKARLPEPPRKLSAPEAGAGGAAGARGVRGGRAGPRRGDRRPPHDRRRQESLGHARRPFSPRQVRRGV